MVCPWAAVAPVCASKTWSWVAKRRSGKAGVQSSRLGLTQSPIFTSTVLLGVAFFNMDGILLIEEALKLSPFERAQLIDALWQSLDSSDQGAIDQAWLEESQDRLRAYRQGDIEAVDGERSLSDLKERLSR